MAAGDGQVVTLDTNIAIYAFSDEQQKAAAAFDALTRSTFVSVQLLNEFANVLVRKRRLPWPQVAEMLDDLRAAIKIVLPLDEVIHREGLRLAERYGLSLYDALMVSAALSGGARTIYSEDMQHDLVIDGTLRIVDPFR